MLSSSIWHERYTAQQQQQQQQQQRSRFISVSRGHSWTDSDIGQTMDHQQRNCPVTVTTRKHFDRHSVPSYVPVDSRAATLRTQGERNGRCRAESRWRVGGTPTSVTSAVEIKQTANGLVAKLLTHKTCVSWFRYILCAFLYFISDNVHYASGVRWPVACEPITQAAIMALYKWTFYLYRAVCSNVRKTHFRSSQSNWVEQSSEQCMKVRLS